MKYKKTLVVVALLLMVVPFFRFTEARSEYSYKGDLKLATEYPPPGEAEAIQKIITLSERLLTEQTKKQGENSNHMWRDAHPKQHGLVKAEFTVLDTLHEQYRVGLFKKPKTYKAWIRFSNLSLTQDPDTTKDIKGMAIKLMGVEGEKLLPEEFDGTTQDFLFMSTPVFASKDVESFANIMTAMLDGTPVFIWHLITHPRLTSLFISGKSRDNSLFDIEWGSTTPYLFGVRAVKYAVRPSQPSFEPPAKSSDSDNYLRERMVKFLSEKEFNLDFYIQVQTDARRMPIEDPRVEWDENRSPLIKVATIRIFRQEFDTKAQHEYGDQLSFTPWHSLLEHRPLGGINRGRKVIYTSMSKFRHDFNGQTSQEPTDWIDFPNE